jgi:hypothetical protein
MPSDFFWSFADAYGAGETDLNGPLGVLLVANEPDIEHHRTVSDLEPHEVSGPGYRPGGQRLSGVRWEGGYLLADNVLWPQCSVRARGAVVYQKKGDRPLVAFIEFAREVESVRGEFEIAWPGGQVLNMGQADPAATV